MWLLIVMVYSNTCLAGASKAAFCKVEVIEQSIELNLGARRGLGSRTCLASPRCFSGDSRDSTRWDSSKMFCSLNIEEFDNGWSVKCGR